MIRLFHPRRLEALLLASLGLVVWRGALPGQTLAERLGFSPTDRVLIINADDVGMCHASNAAAEDALENGLATSASIMPVGAWFPEIAAYAALHPAADFGVHLALTSEWTSCRWGPVASSCDVPGLIDPAGYLWANVADVYTAASPREAESEAGAQIRRALAAGIDVTHLDSHMGAMQIDRGYFEVYRRLASQFGVPVRMISSGLISPEDLEAERRELDFDGTLYPDFLILDVPREGETVAEFWSRMLRNLPAGVTEIYIHPAVAGEEIAHITDSWADRTEEYRLFTTDPEIRHILQNANIKRIGYRSLRDLQRRTRRCVSSSCRSELRASAGP